MLSLTVFLLWLAIIVVALAGAMALAARAVGSERGRFWVGMRLVGILVTLAIAFTMFRVVLMYALAADLRDRTGPDVTPTVGRSIADQQIIASVLFSLLQLGAAYAVIRRAFRLSAGRAFAPFGAYIGGLLGVVAVGFLVVRPYLVEGFVLPMPSMGPTLVSGDHIAANKTAHPRRWDILAYHSTSAPNSPVYCKRLVALPGETLTFDGHGGLLIDGKPVTAPPVVAGRYFAAPPGPAQHLARHADGEPIRLSDHQVFFIGDNVDLSYDSRFTGPSDAKSIIGVVDLICWPPGRMRLLARWPPKSCLTYHLRV